MTILDRDTLIDRPELVNRDSRSDDHDEDEQSDKVEKLGDGGGVVINGLEFENGDLDVIAGANTCAALVTGQEDGEVFNKMFQNSAIQLKEMKNQSRDIELLSHFGVNNRIGSMGLDQEQRDKLVNQMIRSHDESVEEESEPEQTQQDVEPDKPDDPDIDDIEEEISDISSDEETDGTDEIDNSTES